MNNEKIKELVGRLRKHNNSFWETIITEWFKNNFTVIGLTEEQIYQVARRVCELGFDNGKTSILAIENIITEYLASETFYKPTLTEEQVVSLAKFTSDLSDNGDDWEGYKTEIEWWLKTQTFGELK